MTTRGVALVLMAALAATGCATTPNANTVPSAASPSSVAAATVAPSPTVSPSPKPTPAPTPTPVPTPDIEAIGAAYLEFSDWMRETSSAIGENLNDGTTTDAEAAVLFAELVAAYEEGIARLNKVELPDDLADEQATIVGALTTAAAEFLKLSTDLSYDPGDKISDAQAAVSTAGLAIREALGLPPPPSPKPSP